MGWTTDLLTGIAQHLADGGLGTWRPNGPPYGPSETAIAIGEVPPDPDRCIVLTLYDEGAEDGVGHVAPRLQVRMRAPGPTTAVLDLADAVRDRLLGWGGVRLGEAWLGLISLYNGGNLGVDTGPDGNDRHERFLNLDISAGRPANYQ